MPSVANKPFMLGVVRLTVAMLRVGAPIKMLCSIHMG
jgi:hypothetical protein